METKLVDGKRTLLSQPEIDEANQKREEVNPEEIKEHFELLVNTLLAEKAKEYRYYNIETACSYASAPNPFQVESQAFVTWRGLVWKKVYEIQIDVESGNRAIPTDEEFLNELPELTI
jgi:hypothetical protein